MGAAACLHRTSTVQGTILLLPVPVSEVAAHSDLLVWMARFGTCNFVPWARHPELRTAKHPIFEISMKSSRACGNPPAPPLAAGKAPPELAISCANQAGMATVMALAWDFGVGASYAPCFLPLRERARGNKRETASPSKPRPELAPKSQFLHNHPFIPITHAVNAQLSRLPWLLLLCIRHNHNPDYSDQYCSPSRPHLLLPYYCYCYCYQQNDASGPPCLLAREATTPASLSSDHSAPSLPNPAFLAQRHAHHRHPPPVSHSS